MHRSRAGTTRSPAPTWSRRRDRAMTDRISPKQFQEAEGVKDWRVLGGDGGTAFFRTGSFAASARLVLAISELPGVDDQRLAVDVRHDGVTVRMITFTKDYAGMTRGHVELA